MVFVLALFASLNLLAAEIVKDTDTIVDARLHSACDEGVPLAAEERKELLKNLRISMAGRAVLTDFEKQYGSLANLLIEWDSVSYSQVANVPMEKKNGARAPASTQSVNGYLGTAICVHLAHKLPDIEHVADLAHELTHATRLETKVLHGEVENVDQFVKARLGSKGGEADAFSVECRVKREVTGDWDELCSPYVRENEIDVASVVRDLYNGRLSASLTGETYPVMLSRQFNALAAKRGLEKKTGLQ